MNRSELAALLVNANNGDPRALLNQHVGLADVELAVILKNACLDGWSNNPAQAIAAASALKVLLEVNSHPEIAALCAWSAGLEALVGGHMERAIESLDQSHQSFIALAQPHAAASTDVSKLIALAMLGRYEEAIACGMRAREIFLAHGDLLAACKIEGNIGNLWFRRDHYHEAEEFQRLAKSRFEALNHQKQLAIINNCLANTCALLHKFKLAEDLYEEALQQAEASGQIVRLAEIEGNIGIFALLQGRYDRALDYLERSRRRYASLGMPHQSAIAEQEIADAYLELNLIPEAAEIYERVTKTFAELGLHAEEARAHTYHARAAIMLGQSDKALRLLQKGAELYAEEGNSIGGALIKLTEAQLHYAQHDCRRARAAAALAEPVFAQSGAPRRLMFARWLQGEAARGEGSIDDAQRILKETLAEFGPDQPDLAARCLTSLGRLAIAADDRKSAEASFKRAVTLIEELRAPLPAEEFRTSFFADKLTPYHELARLYLKDARIAEAFEYVERARARALADVVGGTTFSTHATDEFAAGLLAEIERVRAELNYFYRQTNLQREAADREHHKELQAEVRLREERILEVTRQLQHRGQYLADEVEAFDLSKLQSQLGPDAALIEYASFDEELLAFVVTHDSVEVVENLAHETEVAKAVTQFRFQIDSLRFGSVAMRKHLPSLTSRAQKHLELLHSMLISPLRSQIGSKKLVIVPHRTLHYLPFQALHDGTSHLIERHEISYAPSAAVLLHCLQRERGKFDSALLMGVADETIPRVREEIESIQNVFPKSMALLDEQATIGALQQHAENFDVLHLACHAQFRSDNPVFSSLQLSGGWFTVRDASKLKLRCNLVTLSACETGVNAVMPGDELIGLSRGFFAAGAPAVLLSLWTVDDEATGELMSEFYSQLRILRSASGALQAAQLRLLKEKPHPFFWAAFMLTGRW